MCLKWNNNAFVHFLILLFLQRNRENNWKVLHQQVSCAQQQTHSEVSVFQCRVSQVETWRWGRGSLFQLILISPSFQNEKEQAFLLWKDWKLNLSSLVYSAIMLFWHVVLSSAYIVGIYAVYQELVEVLFCTESLCGSALEPEWTHSSLPTTAAGR